ncbi:MAG: matrixin family metalloprotease [Planctomycetales bacterium]|nr:matrixin family metalloprotease [Planctomycetales bacterium]
MRTVISVVVIGAVLSSVASAYVPGERWSITASGSTGSSGSPATLTWSFVPDGASIQNEGASDLLEYLDGIFNVTTTSSDLTQRPWFRLFEESLDRWSQVSGLTFVYEPEDTGSPVRGYQPYDGVLGTRGDIRIGGSFVDGSSGTLAYTYLPEIGDLVVDTGETTFYSDSTGDYLGFRNTITHEIGHAFGLLHVESSTDALLLEPYIDLSFDGPQLDDIRGVQGLYGDAYEKSNGGLGNGVYQRATALGSLQTEGVLAIGSDAIGGQRVEAEETDFVSISSSSDMDFFSFSVDAPLLLDVTLTPLGGVFSQGVEGGQQSTFDANSRNDLALAIFASDGTTLLGSADFNAAGGVEQLSGVELAAAGTYYARVVGDSDSVQLYQLELEGVALLVVETADFNGDGVVDAADYTLWRDTLGATGSGLLADGNHDLVVDRADYQLWRELYGTTSTAGIVYGSPVPETINVVTFVLIASVWLPYVRFHSPGKA